MVLLNWGLVLLLFVVYNTGNVSLAYYSHFFYNILVPGTAGGNRGTMRCEGQFSLSLLHPLSSAPSSWPLIRTPYFPSSQTSTGASPLRGGYQQTGRAADGVEGGNDDCL